MARGHQYRGWKHRVLHKIRKLTWAARHPREAMRKAAWKGSHLWVTRGSVKRERELRQIVLAAYAHPEGPEHRMILQNWRRFYGIDAVEHHQREHANKFIQEVWQAQCELFEMGERINLGTCRIGFEDLRIYCSSSSVLGSNIFLRGAYDELTILRLYQELGIKVSAAIDVGANVGVHTLVLASLVAELPNGKVIAYEPRASLAQRLRDNLELNKLSNQVAVRQFGAWVTNGAIGFNEDRENFNQGVGRHDGDSKTTIEVVSLDEDLAEIDSRIGLIKIDVEGAELQVIQGAQAVLSAHRPHLMIEHNSPPWSLEQIRESVPYAVTMVRIPNTFYERIMTVNADTDLQGFNNLLLRPCHA